MKSAENTKQLGNPTLGSFHQCRPLQNMGLFLQSETANHAPYYQPCRDSFGANLGGMRGLSRHHSTLECDLRNTFYAVSNYFEISIRRQSLEFDTRGSASF